MKRCPECRRDYTDDTLSFCLEDGTPLVYGMSSAQVATDEPATAILVNAESPGESPTPVHANETNETAILPAGMGDNVRKPGGLDKRLLAAPFLLAIVVLVGFFGYRYFAPDGGQINSIAVLPFLNKSGNADAEYLSDGLALIIMRWS